jgi:hypothetical protein
VKIGPFLILYSPIGDIVELAVVVLAAALGVIIIIIVVVVNILLLNLDAL